MACVNPCYELKHRVYGVLEPPRCPVRTYWDGPTAVAGVRARREGRATALRGNDAGFVAAAWPLSGVPDLGEDPARQGALF
ncbi:hypothetical protein F4561_003869 [Lipingzhangella halophila]|uniref:Uncharacterized protein n=1 Tax=Lipingzhangella halophila TaxID=1783352 RepID=A0A7W7RJA9_9ACTN|nr:hypothetical protein [Lipingzhangella halophila]